MLSPLACKVTLEPPAPPVCDQYAGLVSEAIWAQLAQSSPQFLATGVDWTGYESPPHIQSQESFIRNT